MPLKKYDVIMNGRPTTLKLSDNDAAAMGLLAKARKPENKAKAPLNKEAAGDRTRSAARSRKRR